MLQAQVSVCIWDGGGVCVRVDFKADIFVFQNFTQPAKPTMQDFVCCNFVKKCGGCASYTRGVCLVCKLATAVAEALVVGEPGVKAAPTWGIGKCQSAMLVHCNLGGV